VGMSQTGQVQPGGGAFGQAALVPGGMAFELAKKWWVLAIRGVLLIIIGLLAMVNPLVWVTFVGIYMLVEGVSMLFSGFSNQPPGQNRWPLVIIGVLSLLAGLIILWRPGLSLITLTYVISAWAIVAGILTVISAIRLREEIDNEWWLIISGALAIIFGVLVFTGGEAGIIAGSFAIATVFGMFAILVGILSIVLALRVRDFGTQIGAVT
ncbi:MAG: HdeD family acid-resistance protein, partial [Chloroflexia bacterium]|nr:HdeD family acid-resistance protein [Chloroflexia bacterium]